MTVEINNVEITKESIIITGLAIEDILLADDLFEEFEIPEVCYKFERASQANMKYLWKICQSQRRCQKEKSMGAKLEKLEGVITNVSESFRVHS